jgi:hypothetical protein
MGRYKFVRDDGSNQPVLIREARNHFRLFRQYKAGGSCYNDMASNQKRKFFAILSEAIRLTAEGGR